MKKIQKKLVLKKKTIAQLSEQDISFDKLKELKGGGSHCCTAFDCPTFNYCPTTSNYQIP